MDMPSFERILDFSTSLIRLRLTLGKEIWRWLEACASGCGLHLRAICEFKVHVFLGAVKEVDVFMRGFEEGWVEVECCCVSRSSSSYLYTARLFEEKTEKEILRGNFLMVKRAFGSGFEKDTISSYFKGLLICLKG